MPNCKICGIPFEYSHYNHRQVVCHDHIKDWSRLISHNARRKHRGLPPVDYDGYLKTRRNKNNKVVMWIAPEYSKGPNISYIGNKDKPCLRCEHAERDRNAAGCVRCKIRVVHNESVTEFQPV